MPKSSPKKPARNSKYSPAFHWKDLFIPLLGACWKILSSRVSSLWLPALLLPMLLLIPFDAKALANLRFTTDTAVHRTAQMISQRGDFYNATFILVGALLLTGWIFKQKRLRILAIAMLLSCATAGLSSLAIRVTSGRPRPSLQVPDGLYGLQFKVNKYGINFLNYDYQSFPSGHATTAFATAVPALIVAPAIGIPLTIAAVGVSWARFQLNRHRISDLYAGLVFGGIFGWAFGRAAKNLSRS